MFGSNPNTSKEQGAGRQSYKRLGSLVRGAARTPQGQRPGSASTPASARSQPPTPGPPTAFALDSTSSDADAFFDAQSDFSRASSLLSEAMSMTTLSDAAAGLSLDGRGAGPRGGGGAANVPAGVQAAPDAPGTIGQDGSGPLVSLAFTQWSAESPK